MTDACARVKIGESYLIRKYFERFDDLRVEPNEGAGFLIECIAQQHRDLSLEYPAR